MLTDIFGKQRATDWRQSRAHLLLLSRYAARPVAADAFARDVRWTEVLGEPLPVAIQRLLADGALVRCDLAEHLDRKLTVSGLRDLLKARGLKASGRKSDLIGKLIAADPDGARQAVAGLVLVKASSSGQALASQYTAAEAMRRLQAEQQAAALLRHKYYAQAARVTYAFEAAQVFPREELFGAWSVAPLRQWWATKDPGDDEALLREVWAGVPAVAARLSQAQQESLRVAAGLRWLWGNRPEGWLPEGFQTGLPIANEWLTLSFQNYGWHHREVKRMKARGIKHVQIGNCNDGEVCPACWALSGGTYPIDRVPELPYSECTSQLGCRCSIR